MLEAHLQRLVNKIIEVENFHVEKPGKESMLSRNWESIFRDSDGWVILKVSSNQIGGYWMHPALYPASNIDAAFQQGLHRFSIRLPSAAYSHVMSGDDHWLEPYWENGVDFDKSEVPLFFDRQHYGRPKGKEHYIEFNQLVTHPLGLHWSPNKNSYCSVNDMGEEVEKIKSINSGGVELILIGRRTLDKLLYLGKWVLVRYFIFNRWATDHPPFRESYSKTVETKEHKSRFEIRTCGKENIEYIEFRGVQIERPTTPKDQLLSWRFNDEEEEHKKNASFIVQDWKNKRLLEDYSIEPTNFANYFTKSDLPFETSPIFFSAEVLDKYRNNPDKYGLDERTINCRGGWHLETYDINEHNQVHTYAIYLSRLPYKEQLHWKQYNEKPKGAISKRSFQTDFEAQFPDEEPKLSRLQRGLEKLGKVKLGDDLEPVWSPKGGSWETAAKGLFYVKTENPNQWHDFVIALANVTNEGFQTKTLKNIAAHYGNEDGELRSLGLLKFIIKATGNEDYLQATHGVFNDLQKRRGRGKAHGTWDTPEGSLIEDADKRLDDVIVAVENLNELFSEGNGVKSLVD